MLERLRTLLHTTLGIVIALALFIVIALAFGLGGITSSSTFGGMGGGTRAASVGGTSVGTAELSKEVNQAFESVRQQNPKITMKQFIAQGGFEDAANVMFDRIAITVFGKRNGIVADKPLVDSELIKIPALQGLDGKFDDKRYQQLLAERHLSDADVRQQINQALVARQALRPATMGATIPMSAAARYAAILKEHRIGAGALLPSALFAPRTKPSDSELAAFYAANQASFIRPERRVIRYAIFDASVVKNPPAPTDAEIAAYFSAHASDYAASESRKVTLLVLPDQTSAMAVVHSGSSLNAAAQSKGLATSTLGPLTRAALSLQSSPDVASAAFSAHQSAMFGPIKTMLGWYVGRLDAVNAKPARTLVEEHGAIVAVLAAQKKQAALGDLTSRIDSGFESGGALSDAAKSLGLSLQQTPPITANGQVYGTPASVTPAIIAKIIPTAFAMDHEGQPQLAELQSGTSFIIYDVSQITRAAPAKLIDIRNDVAIAWALQKGADTARLAAFKVIAAVHKGIDLNKALASLGIQLPPSQPLSMTRDQVAAMNGQVPPAVALFFDMTPGTAKLIQLPGNRGWMVINLTQDIPGTLAANDPLIAKVARELSRSTGNEYADELRIAVRNDVGIKRNPSAMDTVKHQLIGGN